MTPLGKKILIIDDEEPIVELISNVLEKYRYEPIVATRWTEAMDAIGNRNPDLVLLDLKMPTIDGPSLLEFIRREGFQVPVIVVSGFVTDEVEAELVKLNVSAFVRKPFKVRQLRREIERVLGMDTGSGDDAATGASPSTSPFYHLPIESVPEPDAPAETHQAASSEQEILNALQKRAGSSQEPQSSASHAQFSDHPAEEEQRILKAFQKTTSAPSRTNGENLKPKESPSGGPPPSPLSSSEPDARILQAFQQRKQGQASHTPPAETGQKPSPAHSGQHALFVEPAAQNQTASPPAQSRRNTPRRPRLRRQTRKNLAYMTVITVACLLVAGFLAAMQWYASQVNMDELKANATRSMGNQVKEELLKELRKQQTP